MRGVEVVTLTLSRSCSYKGKEKYRAVAKEELGVEEGFFIFFKTGLNMLKCY